MTPIKQEIMHDPANGLYGDCARACYACLLDLPLDKVPHFFDGVDHDAPQEIVDLANNNIKYWLHGKGYASVWIYFDGTMELEKLFEFMALRNPGIYYTLTGKSPRFDNANHTVVCMNDHIVCDPHPSDAGLDGAGFLLDEPNMWMLEFLVPINMTKA